MIIDIALIIVTISLGGCRYDLNAINCFLSILFIFCFISSFIISASFCISSAFVFFSSASFCFSIAIFSFLEHSASASFASADCVVISAKVLSISFCCSNNFGFCFSNNSCINLICSPASSMHLTPHLYFLISSSNLWECLSLKDRKNSIKSKNDFGKIITFFLVWIKYLSLCLLISVKTFANI